MDLTTTLALPSTTDVGTLDKAGGDFASLMKHVGDAVATTQQRLTENSADTTSQLATKLVDVVAVQKNVYDASGHLDATTGPILAKESVLTFVSPVYYELPVVRLQGRFMMDEFVAATSADSSSSGSGFGVGVGMTLQKKAFTLGASGGFSSGSQSTSVSATDDRTSAFGQMRMFARISPREDVGIPKPLRVFKGPRITISAQDLRETLDGDGNVTERKLSLLIFLQRFDGTPIQGRSISIDTRGIPFSFVPDDTADKTNADGTIEIELKRTFPKAPAGAPPTDTAPKQSVVTAVLGLISNNTTITI
jgi:hypothetical protein